MQKMNLGGQKATKVSGDKTTAQQWFLHLHTFCGMALEPAHLISRLFYDSEKEMGLARIIKVMEDRDITNLVDVTALYSREEAADGVLLCTSWDFVCTFQGYDATKLPMPEFLEMFIRNGPVRTAQILMTKDADPLAAYTLRSEYINALENVVRGDTSVWQLSYSSSQAVSRPKQHVFEYLWRSSVDKDFPFGAVDETGTIWDIVYYTEDGKPHKTAVAAETLSDAAARIENIEGRRIVQAERRN